MSGLLQQALVHDAARPNLATPFLPRLPQGRARLACSGQAACRRQRCTRLQARPSDTGSRSTALTGDREGNGAQPDKGESSESSDSEKGGGGGGLATAGILVAVMVLGVSNRILNKMALQPLGDYTFFLAQCLTFGYVAVYFGILEYKKRRGDVTQEMLEAPDYRLFWTIGAIEAISQLLGLAGAKQLPGVLLPLLQQSVLLWQVLLAYTILQKSLSWVQLGGTAVVIAGVCIAVWPTQGSNVFAQVSLGAAGLYVLSMLFTAFSSSFKEQIFTKAKEKLNGKQLDIFVVNSFGSGAQAVAVLLSLPLLTRLQGIDLAHLPAYLSEGWTCLRGASPGCEAAPKLAFLYVACNLAFNISVLSLLRSAGNVVSSLALQAIIPLTIYAFTFPLPYLDPAPQLGARFAFGTVVMLAGLLGYNSEKWLPALKKKMD